MLLAPPAAHIVTLPAGNVDGHVVLGTSIARIEAALGRPLRVERFPVRRDLVYRGLEVITDGRRAWAILITAPSPQAVAPRIVERRLRASGLHEGRRYRCDARGCFGTFFGAHDTRRVIYGVNRGRPYLGVQMWPNP